MEFLEMLASLATLGGIYCYNTRNIHAPFIYTIACILWMIYSFDNNMYWYFGMNLALFSVTVFQWKKYQRFIKQQI